MLLRVSHLTRYYYSQTVSLAPHRIFLRPRETPRQRLRSFRLDLAPPARVVSTVDEYENAQLQAYWDGPTSALNIHVEFEVETLDANPFDFLLRSDATAFPFAYNDAERAALAPYLTRPDPATETLLGQWIAEHLLAAQGKTLALVTALNTEVRDSIQYVRRDEDGIQPSLLTLERGSGSCRDLATLLIDVFRTLGVAARFVSGYLYEPPPDNPAAMQPTAMHAWVEVCLPGAGWRGLDPTRGIFCDDAAVAVAHAVRGEYVNPIQGSFVGSGPVAAELHADIVVERIL